MATCSSCKTSNDLYVWYIPDPYNDYPLQPQIICKTCPPPTNPFKDAKSKYNPDFHDHLCGFKDYRVDLEWFFHGPNDVMGICFECDGEMNMSKGYGCNYVPQDRWDDCKGYQSVGYCQTCYRERCKNHVDFTQITELEKLDLKLTDYWQKTRNGRLV